MTEPVRTGLIGCGVISNTYLQASQIFPVLNFVACADINPSASDRCSEKFNIAANSIDELLHRDDIEVVLNLTVPQAHAEVNLAALNAGKHAYCEKPFGLNVEDGIKVLKSAKSKNLLVGCAPDTFLLVVIKQHAD